MRARVLLPVIAASVCAFAAQRGPFNKQRVTFQSGNLTLVGYAYHPDGAGPFPTIIWNHGSEPNPGGGPQFDSVAAMFVPAGFAVFAPIRRGQSDSQGEYIMNAIRSTYNSRGDAAAERTLIHLHETEQLDDQLAGLAFAKTLPFVDTTRLGVAGCSFGGIQTLLAAERGAGFKAAMPISPAALSWQGHAALQARLLRAVGAIKMPVLLIQPPKDASLEPARVLGEAARRAGKTSFTTKVFPATMPSDQQPHCFGGAIGMRNWAADAVAFFRGALR